MDQSGSSQPTPMSLTAENPVVAVGRKVKSALSTQQRPSIRILRDSSQNHKARREPTPGVITEKKSPHLSRTGNANISESPTDYPVPHKQNASANRFTDVGNRAGTAIRSFFRREENNPDDGSVEREYDPDTVDLLDVMGTYGHPSLKTSILTLRRPRSINTFYPHQYPKFPLRPFAREGS
jgi:hypothetical protein